MKVIAWLLACWLFLPATPAWAADEDEMRQWLPETANPAEVKRLDDQTRLRSKEMGIHQALGLATLVALGGMAVTGQLMRDGNEVILKPWHRGFLAATLVTYLTAGTLSLVAPKPPEAHKDRLDTTAVHRNMAWLHVAGMTSTLATGLLMQWSQSHDMNLMDTHTVLGYATFGVVGASALVMTLEF